ncbi:alanine--tRNA ligase [Suilimivivens aceti]|uniref:Alanine--tRNA ligase n=1 Tax=Suilimivivens aceti TaxID=2981774 RepID=A0ABT2T2G8_9FIRM|nr:alanine--tRNA ligase [Suilimivivens aceti]MCU6743964.1 alanine--tRNA ligase [Suilimivivens aceti]SCH49501.1 Alanine--tRNA ligase [uncultured Clostridium sp.]
MKQFTSNELRNAWKQFYIERGHVDVGAVSLVSDGSTGVLFNVAGMQPLMPYLLGKKHPLGTRLCNVQGCVRTNDIDSVGDRSHVTFFEMLGSWSLGDYFKKERCQWSFELLTQVFGFDADHLAATVFEGDENAPRDEEGAKYRIASGFKKENIYYLPAEDNWWGLEYGPCGPDSEMFYIADRPDCGPDCGPGCDCGKYTELGNDVFMQYEKHHDGHLTPLKQKNVDTGWGLERILAFLNGTRDVYRIDLFAPVIAYIEQASGTKYEEDEKLTRSMRILADHIRTSVMLIGDEAKLLPSNAGAGYVLRRLIRRAVRHGRVLGLSTQNLLHIAEMYIDTIYAESYPLLKKNKEFVLTELKKEIDRFESTVENGMKEFKKILEQKKEADSGQIDGKSAFYLYDTFGFPIELTVELAGEEGLSVDEDGFAKAMEEQKQKARDNQNFSTRLSADNGLYEKLDAGIVSEFIGYDTLKAEETIAAVNNGSEWKDSLKEGEEGTVITAKTPFYATMGGQKGDFGVIMTKNGTFDVQETVKLPGGRIGHIGKVVSGSIAKGETATLEVSALNRSNTCRNHTATHLLQEALREVLGDHVEQSGSYQDGERTRFDFSHGQAMTAEEIKKVEAIVNEKIAEDLPVETKVMSLEEAKKTGAMALFGEKYGDTVRVVMIGDFSRELCGGTHVGHTGDIASFKILSESGVAAGIRRIEALTGRNVTAYYQEMEEKLAETARILKTTPASLTERAEHLMAELKALQSENESLKSKAAKEALGDVMDQVVEVNGVKLLATKVSGVDMNGLRELGDQLKSKIAEGIVVLMSDLDGKVNMVAMATDGAMKKGAHAGNLIKGIAALVGGGGGGRPNMAQAGGKNPAGIDEAIKKSAEVLKEQIK